MGSLVCRSSFRAVVFALFFSFFPFTNTEAYYTTKGQNVVDRVTGDSVVLKGWGIGGWLLPEGYMWGSNLDCPRKIEPAVIALIGATDAIEFWRLYHWNWLTESDVHKMKCVGANTLRIPMNANVIQPRDSQPSRPPYRYDPAGWLILDSLVRWCDRYHMGIIWDMHGAPGSQNGQNISDGVGNQAGSLLWTDTTTYWPRCIDLWFKIADRYKNEKCIVGYDLLNEPLNGGSLLRKIYVRLTDTIRTVDTAGIIFAEGDGYATNPGVLTPINWDRKNHICLAFHSYPPTGGPGNNGNMRTTYNIPLWEGETGEQGPGSDNYGNNRNATTALNKANVGWNWWTHKKFNSQNQPWSCPKTNGFQTILNYWNSGGNKPNADSAKKWLFDQATRTNSSYCTFLPNMVSSLVPFNPNAVCVTAVQPHQSQSQFQTGSFIVRQNGAFFTIEMPLCGHNHVSVIGTNGRVYMSQSVNGSSWYLDSRSVPFGVYSIRVQSGAREFKRRILVSR
jgi:endoglucanase